MHCQANATKVLGSDGTRSGFDVVTVPDGRRGILARKEGLPKAYPKVGKYSVDVASFEQLALPTLDTPAGPEESSTVYVLDEVGRMELLSERFKAAVRGLLNVPSCRLVGALTAPIYGHRVAFCDEIVELEGICVHKLTAKTRNNVLENLLAALPVQNLPGKYSPTVAPITTHLPDTSADVSSVVCPPTHHFEFYFKNVEELPSLVQNIFLPLHARCPVRGVNLTYKGKDDAEVNPIACEILRKELPQGIEINAVPV